MEQIKFRAWHNIEKTFKKIDSMYFNTDNKLYCIMIGDKPYIFPNKKITILSYTGIKDRDDKEIFEGDILASRYFGDDNFENNKLIVVNIDDFSTLNYIKQHDGVEFKIVGNIYENKELLNA